MNAASKVPMVALLLLAVVIVALPIAGMSVVADTIVGDDSASMETVQVAEDQPEVYMASYPLWYVALIIAAIAIAIIARQLYVKYVSEQPNRKRI